MDFFRSLEIIAVSCNVIKSRTALSRDTWHVERAGISFRCSFIVTLGSRGYFFLIDTEAALTQNKSGEKKKNRGYFFLLGALRLVDAASPRTISVDKKKISSGTQGISIIALAVYLCSHLFVLLVATERKFVFENRFTRTFLYFLKFCLFAILSPMYFRVLSFFNKNKPTQNKNKNTFGWQSRYPSRRRRNLFRMQISFVNLC